MKEKDIWYDCCYMLSNKSGKTLAYNKSTD